MSLFAGDGDALAASGSSAAAAPAFRKAIRRAASAGQRATRARRGSDHALGSSSVILVIPWQMRMDNEVE